MLFFCGKGEEVLQTDKPTIGLLPTAILDERSVELGRASQPFSAKAPIQVPSEALFSDILGGKKDDIRLFQQNMRVKAIFKITSSP